MKIAIIGWGSLIWDQRELQTVNGWKTGGPVLPIEFSRISSDGRLTLVIDEENGVPVTTRYAQSASGDLGRAIEDLSQREGSPASRIGVVSQTIQNKRAGFETIKAWAKTHKWDAVVWTGLHSNFKDERQVPFTVKNGLAYLKSLSGETKAKAREYFERAPEEVQTPLRKAIGEIGWTA